MLTKNYRNMCGLGGVARIYENGCFNSHIVTIHGSAVAFQSDSKDPFFKIASKDLAWLSFDILLNLSKFSVRDLFEYFSHRRVCNDFREGI